MLYDRMKTRTMSDYGGVATVMPVFAAFYMLFVMANVALPGTSGFVGEFMVIMASFQVSPWVAVAASLTLIVGAAYTLLMFKRVFYGPIHHKPVEALADIGYLDRTLMVILALFVLGLGLAPNGLLDLVHSSVGHVMQASLNHKLVWG